MLVEFGNQLLTDASAKYGFDLDDALNHFQLNTVKLNKKTTTKSANKTKTPKRVTPKIPLPYCGVVVDGWCGGLKMNNRLMTQCTNLPISEAGFCKTCQKQADKNEHGMPNCGTLDARQATPMMEYREPTKNQLCLPYGNIMQKLNITREQAEHEAAKFGLTIPEEQFTVKENTRSRTSSKKKVELTAEELLELETKKADAKVAKELKKAAKKLEREQKAAEKEQEKAAKAQARAEAKAAKTAEMRQKMLNGFKKKFEAQIAGSWDEDTHSVMDKVQLQCAFIVIKEQANVIKAAEKKIAQKAAQKAKKEAKAAQNAANAATDLVEGEQTLADLVAATPQVVNSKTTKPKSKKKVNAAAKAKKAKKAKKEAARLAKIAAEKAAAELAAKTEDTDGEFEETQLTEVEIDGVTYLVDDDKTIYDSETYEEIGELVDGEVVLKD